MTSRLVVSAAGIGAGKTLVTLALCAAFRNAGYRVAGYKTGPDYIDAGLYAYVLGAPAYNLDLWLDGEQGVRRHVAATAGNADIILIEGMIGLFDGDDAATTSTAHLARTLDAAVLTVLDTWTASQTAAAVALDLARWCARTNFTTQHRCSRPHHRHFLRGPAIDRFVAAAAAFT